MTITSGDLGAATVSPTSLTFTPGNWDTYQDVTVSGVADQDLASETVVITLSSAGLPNRVVTATVTDDDTQVVLVSTATLSVTEGSTGTFGVTLQYIPAANVVVSITSGNTAAATVAPATLTFTPANYNVAQNITVTGVEDADTALSSATVTLSAAAATPWSVAVSVIDNDILGLDLSTSSLAIAEGANTTFGVRLTAMPGANTAVSVASGDAGAVSVAPATLTFTTANWNVFQTVTVTGVSDLDAANESVTVTISSAGLTSRTVTVTVADDETQDIVLGAAAVNLSEASSTQLRGPPGGAAARQRLGGGRVGRHRRGGRGAGDADVHDGQLEHQPERHRDRRRRSRSRQRERDDHGLERGPVQPDRGRRP